ncbi:MAG TPA: family 10 glycosylhydrolase, partial [Rubrivivax sp.]|nr:family 10 glycosylhydrolase [Rubrivivax sp.]
MTRRSVLAAAAAVALAACTGTSPRLPPPPQPQPPAPARSGDLPPPPPREFRAAWVATVANIDWPSRPGLPAEAQRAEALAILDRARAIGLNALVLQVRPAGDAVYPSALEPWTEYLSGEQGRPPYVGSEPAWDPLAFWIAEAHRRGMELHAWL